jgi:hypothetical protein
MTGDSGHSRNGSIHQYYKCVTRRKHGDCKKNPVQKKRIEDLVVNEVFNVLNDDYIDTIARKISEFINTLILRFPTVCHAL